MNELKEFEKFKDEIGKLSQAKIEIEVKMKSLKEEYTEKKSELSSLGIDPKNLEQETANLIKKLDNDRDKIVKMLDGLNEVL